MPIIEINAIDTLFFRNGRPFEKGDDNWADGQFPPSPSVIYGAMRTAYFIKNPTSMSKINTDEDPTIDLSIKGIWIKRGNDVLCPAPLDLIEINDKTSNRMTHIKLVEKIENHVGGNSAGYYPYDLIPYFDGKGESVVNMMLDYASVLDHHPNNNYYGIPIDKIRTSEFKIGVGLENIRRSNKEGNLYRVNLSRLLEDFESNNFKNKISLLVSYDFDFVPSIIKIGAEGKTAYCCEYQGKIKKNKSCPDWNGKYFRLVLLTPGFFEAGSIFDFNDILSKGNISVKCICSFTNKPLAIGGWDIRGGENQRGQPKVMRRAVPAGTVFYFSIDSTDTYADLVAFLEKENIDSICLNTQDIKQGFGLFVLTPLFLSDQTLKL